MSGLTTEIFILLLMLLANGVFAMAEIAVVSARKARLKQRVDEGDVRAKAALATASEPARFLSAVQVFITLLGIGIGMYSGETMAGKLAEPLTRLPLLAEYARPVALVVMTLLLTMCTVVLGELVPKRLALAAPERVAIGLAPFVNKLAKFVSPVVWLLTFSTDKVMGLFGVREQPQETPVSEEEVNILIEQGMHAGVFNRTEKEMVEGVLELDKLPVTALMTPRPKIVFINIDDPEEASWRKIVASGHSYFPVYQGNHDQVLGMVAVKALWAHSAIGLKSSLKDLLLPPLVVPETMVAIQLLEAFKKSGKHIALVTDEFGSIQGLATLIDVLEAIVGDLPAHGHGRRDAPAAKRREDGSWLIDATLPAGELKTLLDLDELPNEDDADFQTLGGFIVTYFGRIPEAGDYFEHAGWRFEVVDMDRHRVDKVLVAKAGARQAAA
ncbi:hemolysin family protein [Termitidicoccus mucosus]